MLTIQSSTNEKATKLLKNIPLKYQQMILAASSMGKVTEVEIYETATEFFSSSSVLNESIVLNSALES